MKHGMRRGLGLGLGWGVLAFVAGCGDDGTGGSAGQTDSATGGVATEAADTTGGGGPTSVPTTTDDDGTAGNSQTDGTIDPTPGTSPTTTAVDPSDTDGDTDPSATDPSATDPSGTTGDDLCQGGTLCGQPAACCPAGNECIEDACLPVCESEIRCGDDLSQCCADGQVCSGDECVTPGLPCADSYDCEPGEYCEQTLGQCLPQPDPLMCEVIPDFDELSAVLEWSWEEHDILSIPAVADIDGDGAPEVVINVCNYKISDYTIGAIIVLDGQTGLEKFRIEDEPQNQKYGSHGRSTIALGDVSGDGLPDIVYAGRQLGGKSIIHAIDGQGVHLWGSVPINGVAQTQVQNGGVTLANFDDDPEAEVVVGATLLDHDGAIVWNQGGNGGLLGAPNSYPGGISAVVDLTGDGVPEIVTGKQAWSVVWTPGDPPTVMVTELWNSAGMDGWPAIADLDQNGSPEVVVAASGMIRVLDGLTGKLWCGVDPTGVLCEMNDAMRTQPRTIPGGGLGGPPTVADFDGDGRPEIAVAAAAAYTVFDLNRMGEEVVKPMNDPAPAAGALYRRWSSVTQDQSSNVTGSSVFDFQGDGAAEVTYNDECYARVYDGSTGDVLLQIENSSATIHEYPLVVDADADGNSEILMTASEVNSCNAQGYQTRHGVFLYGDANDEWVPTRRVWTQHTYHVTNATSAGNVPTMEADNWTTEGLNNYRQNSQGAGVFNAADLTVELSIGLDKCLDMLELIATVRNEGALGVPAGILVEFFQGVDATGIPLGTGMTDKALLPGGSTKVVLAVVAPPPDMPADYYVEVDDASDGDGQILECNEDNNSDAVSAAACPQPG